jgi:allantoin racemase
MGYHVRVVTPITTDGFRSEADFSEVTSEDFRISCVQIENGPASIECAHDEALAAPSTVMKVIDAEKEGVDAVVIDCMGDPGVRAARECVSIPVLGPCETSMHIASTLGNGFSVITILQRDCSSVRNLARLYGVSERLISVRSVEIPVLELERNQSNTLSALVEQSALAVQRDGADTIVFGCTGMHAMANQVREHLLARRIDIPVIEPTFLAVRMAFLLASSGLSHSKTAFAPPPRKH